MMPFQDAYGLLVSNTNWAHFLVYSQLRSAGLVVFRHREMGVNPADIVPRTQTLLYPGPLREEPPLQPHFDVYARDGITAFKPTAPGVPDFYVIVADYTAPPPSSWQLGDLQRRLQVHMAAAKAQQQLILGERADLAATLFETPQIKFAILQTSTCTFYQISPTMLPPPTHRA